MLKRHVEPSGAPAQANHSPGRLIAAEREAQSLSPANLAARLRLDTKIIQALERDDFENLPEPMFVKGYIRSITKELGFDSAIVLEAYAEHAPVEPPNLADFASRAPDQVGVNSTVIKVVTYGLIATLVLLSGLWWRANYNIDKAYRAADMIADHSAAPLPYTYAVVEHENISWRIDEPNYEQTEPTAIVVPDQSAHETILDPNPTIDVRSLTVSTNSEAWVEIYDGAGNELFYGLAKADAPVEIAEHGYFRLILGNSATVELRHGTEIVDVGIFSEDGVAQLELGTKPSSTETAQ